MEDLRKHMGLLGHKVKDRVTGFTGVATTIGFDLYGCIQAIVTPGLDEKGNTQDGRWFDINRLEAMSAMPVMTLPMFAFDDKGPADKPSMPSTPVR